MKPLLCLDVDGVLCPFDNPGGYKRVSTGEGDWIWVSDDNRERLQELAQTFRMVWATSWEHRANDIVAPLHAIGSLPVIEWDAEHLPGKAGKGPDGWPDEWVGYHDWKLPWIVEYARDRPFAWIDDEVSDKGIAWATQRVPAALIVRPDPAVGFTDMHVDQLQSFARSLDGSE